MSYFTYLWKNDTWKKKVLQARRGYSRLDYAASNKFRSAGVRAGSTVFIVTVKKGVIFLGGYIQVAKILNCSEAAKYLGQPEIDLWKANEYIVAEPGTEISFYENLEVNKYVARSLEFQSKEGGFVYLKYDTEGNIDRQTLRNVRRLYKDAEKPLLSLLKPL